MILGSIIVAVTLVGLLVVHMVREGERIIRNHDDDGETTR